MLICDLFPLTSSPSTCDGSYLKLYLTEYEFPHLYNYSATEDKLVKDSLSLEFNLIKKDTVITFHPVCDDKEVK